jgi:hypothetical protein
MFGLPPRIEDGEAEEAARELLGGVGLSAVPSGDETEDGDIPGFTTTEGPADGEVNEVEEGVSAAE